MNIQYSGAIDFNPLLKQMAGSPARRNKNTGGFYIQTLATQRSLMKDLGKSNQLLMRTSILGSHINMIA